MTACEVILGSNRWGSPYIIEATGDCAWKNGGINLAIIDKLDMLVVWLFFIFCGAVMLGTYLFIRYKLENHKRTKK